MECKLALSVFRFDAKTDFLPYYKKHFVTIDLRKNVQDLLAQIQAEDPTFDFPKGELAALKINGKALFTDVSIDGIVNAMGKELHLEPLSIKRATKDMIINTDDFYKSFDLLNALVGSQDKAQFEHYMIYHYASSVLDLVEGFQGDAFFAFAYDMIQKYPDQKAKILNIVADDKRGVFLHVRLCKKIYPCGADVEKKITALKNEVMKHRPYANALVEKLSHRVDVL
jgi:succinate dehydrogenase/fumarate reductase-like Fe-S protein